MQTTHEIRERIVGRRTLFIAGVLLLLALAVPLALTLRSRTATQKVPIRVPAVAATEAPSAVQQAVAAPTVVRAIAAPASASAAPDPAPVDVDPDLADAIPAEAGEGDFEKLYKRWSERPDDVAATADMQGFFDSAFTTFDVHPLAEFIRCTDTLCRGRFQFTDLKALYKMTAIDNADGVRIANTFPFNDGYTYSVSVYFSRNSEPKGLLTQTLGD
jgi:hypothetical protein